MATYLALLRGINVGGHKMVAMADLRALAARVGAEDAQTILQSGNLVFRAPKKAAAHWERVLEAETAQRLALETQYFVRTAEEWRDVIARNPYPKEAERDPGRLIVLFMKDAPTPVDVSALRAAIKGRETITADGRHAYIIYPDGMGTSKLTLTVLESKLRTRGTARNWNTVLRLGALTAP